MPYGPLGQGFKERVYPKLPLIAVGSPSPLPTPSFPALTSLPLAVVALPDDRHYLPGGRASHWGEG